MTIQTVNVTTAAGLLTALGAATGGETIVLAAGNYGNVYLSKLSFASNVTIQGGTFSSLQIVSSDQITFEGSTVNFVPDAASDSNSQGIRVYLSDYITINNAKITGGPSVNGVAITATSLDASGNVLGLPVGKGVNFVGSNHVTLSNSEISFFAKGVTFDNGSDVLISNNQIHDLRTTPISGTAIANLTITGNHTWDSHPWNFGGNGDHGDRIHVWTGAAALTGLVITNNYLDQGAGDPLLGIYLDDNGKKLGFTNVVISGNTLIDGTGQGVLLENVSGTISNNNLIWSGTGTVLNNSPRFDVNDGSHNINFSNNTGNVSIEAGVRYLNFINQTGTVSEDANFLSADRDTITIDDMVITAHNSYTLNTTTKDLFFEGGVGDFVGTGNALANHIVGGIGNDTLTGKGGADFLEGKTGNDTYVVDNLLQTIYDSGGTDLVKSSIGWTLQSGLENLTYTGTAGVTLGGNSGPNVIIGGKGNDILIGNGGADTLNGGAGNDTYYLDNLSQTVVDSSGIDTIVSTLTRTLQTGIENLTLSGTANLSATGNASANTLRGNSGNNVLDGKTGADKLYGGAGDDTYIIDNIGDHSYEVVNGIDAGGNDIVKTGLASWTIEAGIEQLIYTGTAAFTGNGNALNNYIIGGLANDVINGGGGDDRLNGNAGDDKINGGAGVDTLTGGTGNDTFIFVKGEAVNDNIVDFNGRGTTLGDSIELRGYGAGSTFTQVSTSGYWIIHDSFDNSDDYIYVIGAVDASDVKFTFPSSAAVAADSTLIAPDAPSPDTSTAIIAADIQAIAAPDPQAVAAFSLDSGNALANFALASIIPPDEMQRDFAGDMVFEGFGHMFDADIDAGIDAFGGDRWIVQPPVNDVFLQTYVVNLV